MDRIDLFKKLYRRCNGYIELRALLGKERAKTKFIPSNTDWQTIREQVDKFCEDHNAYNLFFGVATRDGKGGSKKNVVSIPCLWAEIDFKHFPEAPEARIHEIIDKFPFKATIIINSGGGFHLYWLLEKPVDLKRSEDVQKVNVWIRQELCNLCECQLDNISEIARILRLPGTVNQKYGNKPLCEIVEFNDTAYNLEDFLEKIPAPVTKPTRNNKIREGEEPLNSDSNTKLIKQVKHVVKQIEEKSIILSDDSYKEWLRIGFALADGLGERGRTYFHRVSSFSNKYSKDDCDKQYDVCLNGCKPDNKITIATFFNYAKESGLKICEIVDIVDIVDVGNNKTNKMLIPLQPFPIEVFPESLVGIIMRMSKSLCVEPEVIAGSMLTISSSAIGNTVSVSPKYGYEVPVFVWLIIIAISGYGKTPAISTLFRPVEKRQSKTFREYSEKLKKYKASLKRSNQGKTSATVEEPMPEHFFASDTTVEALGDIFENTPRGILIHRDELAGLILGLNQYKGGAGNDRQHYLELFNGNSWKIDRKTGVKFIPNVGASIIGGIQTTIMKKVFGLDAIDEGLLPRFLLQNTEYKPRKFQRQGIEPDDLIHWGDILEKCYEVSLTLNDNGFVESKILILGEEALNLFEEFYNNYMKLIPFLSDNAKPFVPKLITYCLKIAGILHVIECFEMGNSDIKNAIKAGTIERAIKLIKYYAGQAINALQLYGSEAKKERNELEGMLLKAVFSLENKIKNGKLALSTICECLNDNLPEPLHCASKQVGAMLRKQGLETKQSTGGYYYLLWEEGKIKILRTTSTKSTMSTNTFDKNSQKADGDEDVIDFGNEEVKVIE